MHPNPAYRHDDRALHELLIDQIGFGMVFAQTPDGPRVAHTPILSTGDGAVQFHLARANALSRTLAGGEALVTINGPDAYVSPRWYADRATVPTWDYVALELEGPVRRMEREGLEAMLEAIGQRGEGRIEGGEPWTRADTPPAVWDRLIGAITGFEMEVRAWRPTIKLHQTHDAADRDRIAGALEAGGSPGIAHLMRSLTDMPGDRAGGN